MPLYQHTSGEKVLTGPDTPYDTEMAGKADDPTSGWHEAKPAEPAPTKPKRGVMPAPDPIPGALS